MDTHPRNIKGMRGSWFAKAHGYEENLPIMWFHNYNGKTHILETTWMNRLGTESKRKGFRDFFKDNINKEIPIALAEAIDVNKHPHEIKEYKGVFIAKVLAYEAEIKLQFLKKG